MVLGMDSRKNSNGFAKANGDPNKRKKKSLDKVKGICIKSVNV